MPRCRDEYYAYYVGPVTAGSKRRTERACVPSGEPVQHLNSKVIVWFIVVPQSLHDPVDRVLHAELERGRIFRPESSEVVPFFALRLLTISV